MFHLAIRLLSHVWIDDGLFEGKSNECPVHYSVWTSCQYFVCYAVDVFDMLRWIMRFAQWFSEILMSQVDVLSIKGRSDDWRYKTRFDVSGKIFHAP